MSNCQIVFMETCSAPGRMNMGDTEASGGGKKVLFGSKPFHLKPQTGLLVLIGKSTQTLLCRQFQRNNEFLHLLDRGEEGSVMSLLLGSLGFPGPFSMSRPLCSHTDFAW